MSSLPRRSHTHRSHTHRFHTALIGALAGLTAGLLAGATSAAEAPLPPYAFATVNQTSLRYQLSGNGSRTLVLLHEMGMSLESWDYLYGPLSAQYRVLRYDLRGFGLSEKLTGAVTMEQEVADLLEPWIRAVDELLEDDELLTAVYEAQGRRHKRSRDAGRTRPRRSQLRPPLAQGFERDLSRLVASDADPH